MELLEDDVGDMSLHNLTTTKEDLKNWLTVSLKHCAKEMTSIKARRHDIVNGAPQKVLMDDD